MTAPKPPYTGLTSKHVVVRQRITFTDEFDRRQHVIKAGSRLNRLRLKAAIGSTYFHTLATAGIIVEAKGHKRQ